MKFSRRGFLKTVAAMGAAAFLDTYGVELAEAINEVKDYWHICWLNGSACTGCTISFAQSVNPGLIEIFTSILVGNSGLPIVLPDYMETLQPASGTLAEDLINRWKKGSEGRRILIVEGAVSRKDGYCMIHGKNFYEHLLDVVPYADHVIAFGACACFGGVPSAKPNPSDVCGVMEFLKEKGINKPVINIPCCPGNPDHLVITLAAVMLGEKIELDRYNRPKVFFGKLMHDELCPYRPYYDRGIFAEKPGDEGCRYKIGCKGPMTHTDCALRKWNGHVSYCVEVGAPCIGCAEPGFPDAFEPFYKPVAELPSVLGFGPEKIGEGILAATAAGIAIHAVRHVASKSGEEKEEKK